MQVICARGCGFRVHDRYFETKKQFSPGICPRSNCGGPLEIVEDFTDKVVPGAKMITNPKDGVLGAVIVGGA